MTKKKKKKKSPFITQTQLGSHFKMSSITMGKVLTQMGLRDTETKLPTDKAKELGYGAVSSYDGKDMGIWRSSVIQAVREFIQENPDAQPKEMNPFEKLRSKFNESGAESSKEFQDFLKLISENYHHPSVVYYLKICKKWYDVKNVNQLFKLFVEKDSKSKSLPQTIKRISSVAGELELIMIKDGSYDEEEN